MASTSFFEIQHFAADLPQGGRVGLISGPFGLFAQGTVQVTCSPAEQGDFSLSVSDLTITSTALPIFYLSVVFNNYFVQFFVNNKGINPVKFFTISMSVITA